MATNATWATRYSEDRKEEDCRLYFCLFAIRWATDGAEGGNWKQREAGGSDNRRIFWAPRRGGAERGSPWKRRTRAPNTRREVYIRRGTPRRLDQKDSVGGAAAAIRGRVYQGMSFQVPIGRYYAPLSLGSTRQFPFCQWFAADRRIVVA